MAIDTLSESEQLSRFKKYCDDMQRWYSEVAVPYIAQLEKRLKDMTLYECGRCGAITGVGYKLGDLNVCYDCRMQNTRGYEKLSNEDRRVVTLVRGDGATVKMGISIVTNTASGAQSLVLKPKRAMSMEQ